MTLAFVRLAPSFTTLVCRFGVVGALLLACSAQALILGSLRGDALVGRRLAVSVPIQLDGHEPASAACVEAEVSFGDAKLEASRVRWGWVNPDATSQAVLRIDTTATLDEPVVTVLVRAGCNRPVSRKYVLLAEIPNEPVRVTPVMRDMAALPDVPQFDDAAQARRTAPGPLEADTKSAAVAASVFAPVPKRVRATRQKTTVSAPSADPVAAPLPGAESNLAPPVLPVPAKARLRPEGRKSRLTLEPLPEAERSLMPSMALLTVPVEDGPTRANARALWRSLNAQPQEAAQQSQRLQALEEQVKSLQALTLNSQKNEVALKAQLTQAQDERFMNPLVGSLLALLLCVLGAFAYFGYRTRNSRLHADQDWWRGQSVEPSVFSDMGVGQVSPKKSQPVRISRTMALDVTLDDSLFDGLVKAEKTAAPETTPRPPKKQRSAPTGHDAMVAKSGFFHSSLSARALNVEELFDIQQQAEFFASLGQHEHAISLLQQHIDGATTTSGLAYLDLLALYHQLARRADYDTLRQEFNLLFKAQVPEFDNYQQQGRGLARYSEAMERVERDWTHPRILDTLRDLVFRQPDASAHADTVHDEVFDVTAYRELMLLFVIAKDLEDHRGTGTEDGGDRRAEPRVDPANESRAPAIDLSDFNVISSQFASFSESVARAVPVPVANPVTVSVDLPAMAAPPVSQAEPVPAPALSAARLDLDVDLFALESGMVSLGTSHSKPPLDFILPADPFSQVTHVSEPPRKPQQMSAARICDVEPASRYLDIEKYLHDEQDFLRDLPKKPKSF